MSPDLGSGAMPVNVGIIPPKRSRESYILYPSGNDQLSFNSVSAKAKFARSIAADPP